LAASVAVLVIREGRIKAVLTLDQERETASAEVDVERSQERDPRRHGAARRLRRETVCDAAPSCPRRDDRFHRPCGGRIVARAADRRDQPREMSRDVVELAAQDRKSTRLNSSHVKSSYAVFCLKKKKTGERKGSGGKLGRCRKIAPAGGG